MSDRVHSQERQARSLPPGYQFGDARPQRVMCNTRSIGINHIYEAGAIHCNCGAYVRPLWQPLLGPRIFGPGTDYLTGRDCGDEA